MFYGLFFLSCSLGLLLDLYPRKVLVLLLMECVFLFCFFIFSSSGFSMSHPSFFFLVVFTIFLVLDSVIGVILLVTICRVYGSHQTWFL